MSGIVSEDAVRLAMYRTRGNRRPRLAIHPDPRLHLTRGGPAVDPRHRRHRQAPLQSPAGSRDWLQPAKPKRPSHVYHSYFVANLRIGLGVEGRPGNEHAAAKGLPGFWQTLEKLPRHQWPTFSRGDCGYGNEGIMLENGERGLP